MVLRKRLIGDGFYRLGDHFPWIIPAAVCGLVLLPGTVLALIAWLRRRTVRLGSPVGLLSFVGFLDLCSRLPLESWASLLLSAGSPSSPARLAGARRGRSFGSCARTTPLLVGACWPSSLVTIGQPGLVGAPGGWPPCRRRRPAPGTCS